MSIKSRLIKLVSATKRTASADVEQLAAKLIDELEAAVSAGKVVFVDVENDGFTAKDTLATVAENHLIICDNVKEFLDDYAWTENDPEDMEKLLAEHPNTGDFCVAFNEWGLENYGLIGLLVGPGQSLEEAKQEIMAVAEDHAA